MKPMSLYCAKVHKTLSSNGFYIGAIVNFLNRKYIYFIEYIRRRTESQRILSRTRKTIFSISGIRIVREGRGAVAFV